jgi:hypothetical protein
VQAVVYPVEAQRFATSIAERVAKSLRDKAVDIEKLAARGRLEKLLREPAFGTALRLIVLRGEIGKIADRIDEVHLIEALGRYDAEVMRPRNDFAHRRAVIRDGRLFLEGRTEPFDQPSMTALRLKLLEHSDNLEALLSLLMEMARAAGDTALAAEIADVGNAVAAAVEQAIDEAPKNAGANPPARQ